MTTKMDRRTFLKGAAAAAAAVSLSGLLTGCGGDQLADNEVQIGAYTVKVYGLSAAPWQPLLPSPPAAVPLLLLRHPPLLPLPGALLPAP